MLWILVHQSRWHLTVHRARIYDFFPDRKSLKVWGV